jgi:HK97 family phage prohead protease
MSEQDPERLVREVTFAVEGDGRTIEARIVPYNTPTQVVDRPEHGGTGVPYLERWRPGAFAKQAKAPHRVEVYLNFEHEPGIRGIVGHGVALREEPDALYGTFRVHPGPDGDKALHMVNEGILTGLSVEAIPTRTERTSEGIVDRVRAFLDKVSLCRAGLAAYQAAEVLAVREAPPEPDDAEEAEEAEPEPAVVTWDNEVIRSAPDSADSEEKVIQAEEKVSPQQAEAIRRKWAEATRRSAEVNEMLKRVGVEPLVRRAISRQPWSGATGRFSDEEYERSALICRPGDEPPKQRCSLPVLEPNGDLNVNALTAAAGRLNQVTGITPAMRATAARKILRYYRQAGMEPPESIRAWAAR